MQFELDHLFIMVSEGAPEADFLIPFGFKEGKPNRHRRQGTLNRRFFFQNMMLELVWVSNSKEATNEKTRPTGLWDRWNNRDTKSPFGICMRPVGKWDGTLPFKCGNIKLPICQPENHYSSVKIWES